MIVELQILLSLSVFVFNSSQIVSTNISLAAASENQQCKNCTADQRLYMRYKDGTTPILLQYEIWRF